mgnify:CR=1 FL=1
MRFLFLLAFCTAGPALAESVIATRVIRAQTILSAMDMALVDAEIPGALTDLSAAIGQETLAATAEGTEAGATNSSTSNSTDY